MRTLLFTILLLGTSVAFGQKKTDRIVIGEGNISMTEVESPEKDEQNYAFIYYDGYRSKWRAVGMVMDAIYAQIGLSFSNGYDEFPLIHFEDFSSRVAYKIAAVSDYKKEHGAQGSIGWVHPFKYVSMLSLNASYDYGTAEGLRDMAKAGLEGRFYVKYLDLDIVLEPAYRYLNGENNFGAALGLQKVLFWPYLSAGISGGYFGDYWTCSAHIQSLLFRNMIGLRLSYDKIDRFDFVKVGLSYVINKTYYKK